MDKLALVQTNGRIAQIEDVEFPNSVPFPVALPLKWVRVPADTTTRDTWDGTAVVKFVPEPVEDTSKAEAKRAAHQEILEELVGDARFDNIPEVVTHRESRKRGRRA